MPDLSSPQAEEGLRTAPARLMSGSRRSKTGVLRRAALRPVRRKRGPRARGRLRVPGKTGAAFGPASDSPETGLSCVRAFACPGKTGAAFGPAPGSPETGSSCVRAFARPGKPGPLRPCARFAHRQKGASSASDGGADSQRPEPCGIGERSGSGRKFGGSRRLRAKSAPPHGLSPSAPAAQAKNGRRLRKRRPRPHSSHADGQQPQIAPSSPMNRQASASASACVRASV